MRKPLLLTLLLALSLGGCQQPVFAQASPFNLNIFKAQSFTDTGQTGATIQLNGLVLNPGGSTVGSSYASGTITLTGVALTTVSFQVMGSSDNGATFYLLPISAVATPGVTPVTTVTATANGLYQINLAGLTHIQLVTTGTFTATSVSLTLTASPNASISRNNSGNGSGASLTANQTFTGLNTFKNAGGIIINPTSSNSSSQLLTIPGVGLEMGSTDGTNSIAFSLVPTSFLSGGGTSTVGNTPEITNQMVTSQGGSNVFSSLQNLETNSANFLSSDNTYEYQVGLFKGSASPAMTYAQGDVTTTIANTNINLNGDVKINGSAPGGISAAQLALVPVESFGAVADWNGTTGTDNTTAFQNAINSLQTAHTCGQLLLQGGTYKVTGALSITSSCVGIKGHASAVANAAWYSLPNVSAIINTSASADTIDVAGASSSANVYGNLFDHFNILRSVAPTGTATGLSFNHVTGAEINTVISNDSVRGFYFHNFNSGGVGYIDNSASELGQNGVSETSGTYYGFYVDSTDGEQSASLRLRNSAFASGATGSSVSYGLFDTGNAMNDFMMWNFETADATVGEKFLYTSGGTNFGASDIHLYGTINDQFATSGIVVSGLTAANGAAVEISGGTQDSTSSTGAPIDIEGSNGVSVANVSVGMANNNFPTGILLNGSSLNSITGNSIKHVTANGITLTGSVGNTVTGNTLAGVSATGCLLCVTGGSNQNALSGNTLAGTAASGISVDTSSTNNTGIYTNAYASTLTTDQLVSGSNPLVLKHAPGGTVISTVFNEGTVGATIIGTHPATDVPGNAWAVWATTSDPGWTFKSGGGALGSNPTNDQANVINAGVSDYTLTFSGVTNTSEVLYVFRYANAGNDWISLETLGAGGVALVETVSGTSTTVGTSAVANGATGSIVISAVGRTITVTPFGGTPINYTIPLGHADITATTIGMYYVHASGSITIGGLNLVSVAANVSLMNAGGFALDNAGDVTSPTMVAGGTKFTASGCTNSGTLGGAWAGSFVAGATSCTVVITPGTTAPNGWFCRANDITTPADAMNQTASTINAATLSGTVVVADLINFSCTAY